MVRNMIDFISLLSVLLMTMYVPFMFTFDPENTLGGGKSKLFENIMDVWFIVEIILNFFTAFYRKGILVIDLKLIAINYIRHWFIFDMLGSLPFSWIPFQTISTK
jgi:hypothetical protein